MNRRSFFSTASLAGLLGGINPWAAPAATSSASGKHQMLAKHRNLFTGDSCTYFYNPEIFHPEGLPYTAKAVHRYIDLLADNGVDTFLCNPNAQVAWYPSKKLQTIIDGYKRGDRKFFLAHADANHVPADKLESFLDQQVAFYNLYLDLAEAGVDWLAETTKGCRRRGISPWVSVRMNDTHGVENPDSHFNCALYRKKEFRLSGVAPDPQTGPHPHWMALNYAKPEVRAFMMSHIREYVEDYDFEGIELDWLRDPHCLEPNPTQKQVDVVTDWIGEVRTLTQKRARQLGKPYPMGMRIPANIGYLKSRGVDVKEMVKRGYLDFIGFSNFWQTTWDLPYDELRRELGPDVVFYGVVEDAPNWIDGYSPKLANHELESGKFTFPNFGRRFTSASPQLLWANAAGKLAMGVHGIEQFNFFCTDQPRIPGVRADYSALRSTHDLEYLRNKAKHYCLSTPSTWLSTLWELPEQLPVVLGPNSRHEFRLSMCSEPTAKRAVLQVVTEKTEKAPRLGLGLDGSWLNFNGEQTQKMVYPVGPYTDHLPANTAWFFAFDPRQIREGWNRFTVANGVKAAPCKVVSVEIGIYT